LDRKYSTAGTPAETDLSDKTNNDNKNVNHHTLKLKNIRSLSISSTEDGDVTTLEINIEHYGNDAKESIVVQGQRQPSITEEEDKNNNFNDESQYDNQRKRVNDVLHNKERQAPTDDIKLNVKRFQDQAENLKTKNKNVDSEKEEEEEEEQRDNQRKRVNDVLHKKERQTPTADIKLNAKRFQDQAENLKGKNKNVDSEKEEEEEEEQRDNQRKRVNDVLHKKERQAPIDDIQLNVKRFQDQAENLKNKNKNVNSAEEEDEEEQRDNQRKRVNDVLHKKERQTPTDDMKLNVKRFQDQADNLKSKNKNVDSEKEEEEEEEQRDIQRKRVNDVLHKKERQMPTDDIKLNVKKFQDQADNLKSKNKKADSEKEEEEEEEEEQRNNQRKRVNDVLYKKQRQTPVDEFKLNLKKMQVPVDGTQKKRSALKDMKKQIHSVEPDDLEDLEVKSILKNTERKSNNQFPKNILFNQKKEHITTLNKQPDGLYNKGEKETDNDVLIKQPHLLDINTSQSKSNIIEKLSPDNFDANKAKTSTDTANKKAKLQNQLKAQPKQIPEIKVNKPANAKKDLVARSTKVLTVDDKKSIGDNKRSIKGEEFICNLIAAGNEYNKLTTSKIGTSNARNINKAEYIDRTKSNDEWLYIAHGSDYIDPSSTEWVHYAKGVTHNIYRDIGYNYPRDSRFEHSMFFVDNIMTELQQYSGRWQTNLKLKNN